MMFAIYFEHFLAFFSEISAREVCQFTLFIRRDSVIRGLKGFPPLHLQLLLLNIVIDSLKNYYNWLINLFCDILILGVCCKRNRLTGEGGCMNLIT